MAEEITRKATIQFTADTSNAQAQIQALAQSLQSALNTTSKATGFSEIDKQLQKTAGTVAQLQAQLQSAFNTSTGKLDLTKFNDSLRQSKTSLAQYQTALNSLGSTGNAAFVNLARSITTAEVPLRRTSGLLTQMGVTLKNTIKWNISASIMNSFIGGIQSAFNYVEKLNSSLNRIQIVTGESSAKMAEFASYANKAAQSLSTTTRAYTDAALIFYQQGLNDADVKARTDAVIKMANVTGDAAKEVSNYMTAIWNNFDNGTSSLESFEDKIVSLGATTASSSAEIAAGLEKFAAIGNTIGLSFDYAAAALSTVVAETRQSADTVGTAFRTLFSRLQGLKLGETLDDGTNLNKYSQALATVGVQIKDASGNLKNMDTILDDLAKNWNKLTQAQKVGLAQTVGGARQYTTLISLMENWDQFQKNLSTEAGSEGALQKQAAIYAQSWEAAKNQVTAALESIYSTLIDDKFFIQLNQNLATAISGVNSFITNLGGVKTLLGNLGTIALNVFDKQIAASLDRVINNFKMFTGIGKQEMISLKTEAANLLGMNGGATTGGIGATSMDTAYKNEAAAQLLVIRNAERLDAQETRIANTLLQQVTARTDQQKQIADAADKTEQSLDMMEKKLSALAQVRLGDTGANNFMTDLKELRGLTQDVGQIDNLASRLTSVFSELSSGASASDITEKIKVAQQVINDFNFDNLSKNGKAAFDQLKISMDAALKNNDLQTAKNAIDAFAQTGADSIKVVQEQLENYKNKLTQLLEFQRQVEANGGSISGTAVEQRILFLQSAIPAMQEYVSNSEHMSQSLVDLENAERNAGNATKALTEFMASAGIHIYSTGEQIVTYARAISTAVNGWRTLSNALKTFNDESKPAGERILTVVGALAMFVPMAATSVMALAKMGTSIYVVAHAHEYESIAAAKAAAAELGFGKALLVATPYLAAIAAAIFLVVKAMEAIEKHDKTVCAAVDNTTNSYNRAKKAASEFYSEMNEVKEKTADIKDKFDQFSTVVDALENCTAKTAEWRAALLDVQQAQSDLIANNPEFAKFLRTSHLYGYDPSTFYDENHILTQEAITAYTTYNESQSSIASMGYAYETDLASGLEQRNNYITKAQGFVTGAPGYSSADESWAGQQFASGQGYATARPRYKNGTSQYSIGTGTNARYYNWDDELLPFLTMLDVAVGDSRFSNSIYDDDSMIMSTITGENGTEVSRGDVAKAIITSVGEYGLQIQAASWEEAYNAWVEQYGKLADSYISDVFDGQNLDIIMTQAGMKAGTEFYNNVTSAYTDAYVETMHSLSTSRQFSNVGNELPSVIKEQLTGTQLGMLNGEMGYLVLDEIFGALGYNPDEISEDTRVSYMSEHNLGDLQYVAGRGWVGYDKDDPTKEVEGFQGLSNQQIIMGTEKFSQGYNGLVANGKLFEIISGVFEDYGDMLQFVTDRGFGNYTPEQYNAVRAKYGQKKDAYDAETYETEVLPMRQRIMSAFGMEKWGDVVSNVWNPSVRNGEDESLVTTIFRKYGLDESKITYNQAQQFANLSPYLSEHMMQVVGGQLGSLTPKQLDKLLNFDFSADTSIEDFRSFVEGIEGIGEEFTEADWASFEENVKRAAPLISNATTTWITASDEAISAAQSLASGSAINDKSLAALTAAGFDVTGLKYTTKGYSLPDKSTDILGLSAAFSELNQIQGVITQNDEGQYSLNDQFSELDSITQEKIQEMLATKLNKNIEELTEEDWASEAGQEVLFGIASYDGTGLAKVAAQFGLMYKNVIETYDHDLAEQYLSLMLERQLAIDGLSMTALEANEAKNWTLDDIDEKYAAWSQGKKRQTGISNIAGMSKSSATAIKRTLDKGGVGVTTTEQSNIDNLRQNIANALGMDISEVTDKWLTDNWTAIEDLMSGEMSRTMRGLRSFKKNGEQIIPENEVANWAQAFIEGHQDEYTNQLNKAISKSIKAEQTRDTKRTNKATAGQSLVSSMQSAAETGIISSEMQGQIDKYAAYGGDAEGIVAQWQAAETAAGRYAVAAQLAKESYGAQADVLQETITAATKAQEAINGISSERFNATNLTDLNAYVTEYINSMQSLGADVQNIMQTAWSNISSNLTGDETPAELRQLWNDEIQRLADESGIELTDLAANFGTTMQGIISAQLASEQSAASATVTAWTNAFTAIANARAGIASGKSLSEIFAGDADQTYAAMQLIDQALEGKDLGDMSRQEAIQAIYAGGEVAGVTRESVMQYQDMDLPSQLAAKGYGVMTAADGSIYQDRETALAAFLAEHNIETDTASENFDQEAYDAAVAEFDSAVSNIATGLNLAADAPWDKVANGVSIMALALNQSDVDRRLNNEITTEKASREHQITALDTQITQEQAYVDIAQRMYDNRYNPEYTLAQAVNGTGVSEDAFTTWLNGQDYTTAIQNGLTNISGWQAEKADITAGYVELFAEGGQFEGATAAKEEAEEWNRTTQETATQAENTVAATAEANAVTAFSKAKFASGLYGKKTWTAEELAEAQDYGINVTSDSTYAERQQAIKDFMASTKPLVDSARAEEFQGFMDSITGTDLANTTAIVKELNSELSNTQSLLDNFSLDNLGSNSAASWEAVTKAVKMTRSEFSALSKEQQRQKLGEAQRANLQEQLDNQREVTKLQAEYYGFTGFETREDMLAMDSERWQAYQTYIDYLQQEQSLQSQIDASQVNEDNDLISIRAANLDAKIAALQAANDAEQTIIDNYGTASTNLVNNITTGALTAVEKLSILTALGADAGATFLSNWEKAGTAADRAMLAAQLASEYTERQLTQQAQISADIRGAQDFWAEGKRIGGNTKLSSSSSQWQTSDKVKAMLDKSGISAGVADQIMAADAKVRARLSADATNFDYAEAMRAELATMSSDAATTWEQIKASGKDTLSGIFTSLGEEARTAAQTAVDAWLSAFETIANARATLISGGNLLELLAGDPTKLLELARGTAVNGDVAGQMQRIVQGTTSGTLTARDLQSNLSWSDYRNNQLGAYNLDLVGNGFSFAQEGASVSGDRNRLAASMGYGLKGGKYVDSEGNTMELEAMNEALIDSYSAILQANGMEANAAEELARKAVETGEGYDEVKVAAGNLSDAIDYSTGLYAFQQKQAEDSAAIQAAGDVTKMSTGGRTYDQWTRLQDAISKGKSAASNATDQASWEQAMQAAGYGDALELLKASGIGFDNVNTAANACASALAALTAAAQASAEAEARSRGYEKNAEGKWQKTYNGVTQQQLQDEYGDEAWEYVAKTLNQSEVNGQIVYSGVYVDEGLTSKLKEIETTAQTAQATLDSINLERLSAAASALGTNTGGLESYLQSIAAVEGTLSTMIETYGEWSEMDASTQTMLAEAAVEYNKSMTALEKLASAKDLFKAIEQNDVTDAAKLKDAASAYRDLTQAVNDYFLDGLATPEFVQENLDLIKQWANGAEGAVEELEAKLIEVFNQKYELNIPQDGEYGLGALNGWADGLQFGQALSDTQLDWIKNFQRANDLSDEMMGKLADLCGVALEFNHEMIKVPQNTQDTRDALREVVKEFNKTAEAADGTAGGARKIDRAFQKALAQAKELNKALPDIDSAIQDCGDSTKGVAMQGAKLASIVHAAEDDFIGYGENLDGAAGKAEAVNDALMAAASSGSDFGEVVQAANDSLAAVGDGPIMVQLQADVEGLGEVGDYLDLEGIIEYSEEHPEIDPAVLYQNGTITYANEGQAPTFHTETIEGDASAPMEQSGTYSVTLPNLGPISLGTATGSWSIKGSTEGGISAEMPVMDGATGGTGTRGGGGGARPSRRGRGGGGGGGGGGRRETGDRKKKENRYVTNTNQLEDIQDKLDKINKAESRSYGRNRLKQMQDKAKALKELAAKQKDLYNEAVKYAAEDKKALQNNSLAKKAGIKFEFDENGTILNRDDIEQKMVDYYNSFTDGKDEEGNWLLKKGVSKKDFKEMQEAWDELNEQLDKYDESQDKVKEYWQAHLDAINEAYDVIVEMANYKVEVQVEVSDEALNLLDHMLGKIEDDAYKAAEAIAYMGEQMFEYQAQDAINTAGIRDILAHHDGKSQYADDEGNLHTTSNIGAELKAKGLSVNDLMSGNSDAWKVLMSKEKEFTQDELDSLQDMINAKLEATEKMMETQKEVYEQISNVFDKGTEDMDRIINKMDHLQSITESYSNIVDLVGRKRLGITNDMMDEFEMSGVEQSLAKLRATRKEMETQQTMLSDLQNKFKNGRNELTEEQRAAFAAQATQVRDSTKASREQLAADEKQLKKLQKQKEEHKVTAAEDLAAAKQQQATLTLAIEAAKKREKAEEEAMRKADEAAIKNKKKRGGGGGGGGTRRGGSSSEKSSEDLQKELDAVNNQIKKLNKNEEEYAKKQQAAIDKVQQRINSENENVTLMEEKLALYDQLAQSDSIELTQRDLDLLSDQMEHMEDAIQESTETFYSSWEEAITKISELYTNMMTRAVEDASDKLAGQMGSLTELADAFSKKQEENELYVEDFRKIYELSKLNRDIVNSIDETQNVKAKQRLVEYQAELNQLEQDREKMSEYEIENARRRYELLLAELALEESKNAKSQVQMTRNESGEWSYVYTADESEVEKAEQDYEDKLYAMQRANADYINELQQNIVDMEQAMMEEIESIRVEDYANREEYENAIQAIYDHYGVMMDGYMDQMGIVFGENQRLYTEDWATYSEMTGYKISEDEEYIDKWNETTLGKKTGFDTMEEFHQNFNEVSQDLFDENMDAYDTWEHYIEEAMVDAGTKTDEFADRMNEDVGEMTEQANQLADTMNETAETVVEAFDQMTEALSNWQAEYSKSIEEMLEKNEALAKSFNNLLKEWSGYNETVGQDPTTSGGDDDGGDTGGGVEDPGPPATQEEPEEPESAKDKTKRLKKGVAAAVWGYPGGAGWGHGNSSRKLTSGDRYRRFKEKGLIPDEVQQQINRYSKYRDGRHGGRSGMMKDAGVTWKNYKKYTYKGWGFDTGGYTGEWEGGDGRLAILHSKEIVLNQDDTKNFLAGIEILRDITKTIDINAMANAGYMSEMTRIGGVNAGQLQQQVTISAEFPNATDKESIKEAFNDLINLASQYANRK